MKSFLSFIFIVFYFQIFSQDISGAKPILTAEGTSIYPDDVIQLNCNFENVTITSNFNSDLGSPDSYRIEQVPYHSKSYLPTLEDNTVLTPSDLGIPGQIISDLPDDAWSSVQNLESNGSNLDFCYFGQPKTNFVISSNGLLSFNTAYANNFSYWNLATSGKIEPNANCGDNNDTILMFQDLNPQDSDSDFDSYSFWYIAGIEQERFFVMGSHHMPMYSCGADYGYATSQIVIYETTNIIEYNIKDKPLCDNWSGGFQAFGIQNSDSTIGYVIPGLDNLAQYQILDSEDTYSMSHINPIAPVHDKISYRFIPDGINGIPPVFGWYTNWDNTSNTGILVTNDINLTVHQNDLPLDANGDPVPMTYTAVVKYTEYCSGEIYYATNYVQLISSENPLCDDDGDSVPNAEEDLNNNDDLTDDDTDGDGIPNYLDSDDDNDNVSTLIETTSTYLNRNTNTFIDTDNDTIENYLDNDDDNDGILTINEDYNNNGDPTDDDTNNNGIPDYLDYSVALSTLDFNIDQLKIYPNPSNGILNISYDTEEISKIAITITNINGQILYKSHSSNLISKIDLNQFKTGFYYIKVRLNNKNITKIFFKK